MLLAVLVSCLPVLAGLALAMAPGLRQANSGHWHRVVLALATAVVLMLMLPSAVQTVGWAALGVFAAAFAIPAALEHLRPGHAGHPGAAHDTADHNDALDIELGFAGLLLHQAIEGAELGAIFAVGQTGPAVALVLSLHTVPLVAAVLHGCVLETGVRGGLWRGLFLVLTTALGVVGGQLAGGTLAGLQPWVSAAVGGLLLHTLWHTWTDGEHRPAA
ncbi:MAG: hypothetical protein GXP62_09275 [Oligoflexia bacterium]|nr:hypothetical protein [Oligoflexia bacterium]